MRFGFCLFKYFPYGGLQRDFVKIAQAALARGHDVNVFTMDWQGPHIEGLQIQVLQAKGLTNHARAWHFATEVLARQASVACDAWLGFNRQPGLDLYFAADPCFASVIELRKKPWLGFLPRYRRYLTLERTVYGTNVDTQILLLNPHQQSDIQNCYHTPVERFIAIPPGIRRPEALSSQAAARLRLADRWQGPKDALCFLAVGHDQRRKGLDRSVLALAALPPALKQRAQLWVIGAVPSKSLLKQAAALGVCVCALGNRDDIYDWMQAADLLLHPAYQETAGMVLVEALANGLPVLVTDNCGYAFHIEQAQAGRLIPGGSSFQQSAYNAVLLKSIALLPQEHWQENARRYAASCDWFRMPDMVVDHLEHWVRLRANHAELLK